MKFSVKKSFFYALLAVTATASLSSCKEDKDEPKPENPTSTCNVQVTSDVELYNSIGVTLQSSENVGYMYILGMKTESIKQYSDAELVSMMENSNLEKTENTLKYWTLVQLEQDTDYTFLILPYTSKNLRGSLTRKTFKTATLTDDTPICDFSNYWADGSTLNWEVTPNSNTGAWYTLWWGGETAEGLKNISPAYVALAIKEGIEDESIAIYNGTQEFSYQPEDPEADTNLVVAATWGVSKSGKFSSAVSGTIMHLKGSNIWIEKPQYLSRAKDGKIGSEVEMHGMTQAEMDALKKSMRISVNK